MNSLTYGGVQIPWERLQKRRGLVLSFKEGTAIQLDTIWIIVERHLSTQHFQLRIIAPQEVSIKRKTRSETLNFLGIKEEWVV